MKQKSLHHSKHLSQARAKAEQCDKIPTQHNYQAFYINPTLHTIHSVTYIHRVESCYTSIFWQVAAISIPIIFTDKDITALIKHFNK